MKDAIVTVSSDDFYEGTYALFNSFKRENEWFTGDFVVIDAGLKAELISKLQLDFNCRVVSPHLQLIKNIDLLVEDLPQYKGNSKRFFSLHAFYLIEYKKLLFLDSDILCTGSAKSIFDLESMIYAAPDLRYYLGYYRLPETLLHIEANKVKDIFRNVLIEKLFNTGVMFINQDKLPACTFENLLKLLNVHTFAKVKTGHTDTVVLNKLFLKHVQWLDLKYNFYFPLLQEHDSPVFIHFIGRKKPWNKQKPSKNNWMTKWKENAL